jgi:hypothetical protein
MNEIREAIKKVYEHDEKLRLLNVDGILKRLQQLEHDIKDKADKSDIKKLDEHKADKKNVKEDIEKVWKDIEELRDLITKLES